MASQESAQKSLSLALYHLIEYNSGCVLDLALIKRLLEKGADPNYVKLEGVQTMLQLCCGYQNSSEAIELLIKHGAQLSQNEFRVISSAAKIGDKAKIAKNLNILLDHLHL